MLSTHIIIINFNAGDWLLRSVRSALQTGACKVTVIDNNSTDKSIASINPYLADSRLTVIENDSNRGFAAANNQVLDELDTDIGVLLNPDCEIPSETLPMLLNAFDQHPRLALASCRIVDEQGQVHKTSKRRFPTPWSALVRMLRLDRFQSASGSFADFDNGGPADANSEYEVVEAVSGAFMAVRRVALEEVGSLDEAYFMHCEDLDWCKRFALAGWHVGYVGAAYVTHAKGVCSKSRPIGVLWNLHCGMARFFDKFYREQTAWPIRLAVKLGIMASFFIRAIMSLFRRASQ